MDRTPLIAAAALIALALACAGVCVELAHADDPAPIVTTDLQAGDRAPFAGVLVPPDTLRALLEAQDERDDLRRQLALAERQRVADVAEAWAVADARERARAACEASRAPRCERPWGGWPWVTLGVGLVAAGGVCAIAR